MMGFFTNWIQKIVDKAVADRMAATNLTAEAALAAMKDNIDYDSLANSLIANGLDYHQIAAGLDLSDLADEINTDDMEQQIADKVDTDAIAEKVANEMDTDEIAERVKDNIEIDYNEFDIDYCALAEEIDNDAIADNVRDNLDLDYDAIVEEIDYEELGRALVKLASQQPAAPPSAN